MSETDTIPEPKDTPEQTSAAPETSSGGRGPVLAVLLGGVLAGGIGYLTAYYTEFGLFQTTEADTGDDVSLLIEDQIARLSAVEARLENVGDTSTVDAVQSEVVGVSAQLTDLATRLDGIEGMAAPDLTPLDDRLAALEAQIGEVSQQVGTAEATETDATQSQQLADLTSEIDALTARLEEQTALLDQQSETLSAQSALLDEQTAAIEEARTVAATETNRISAQSAISSIRAAIESGESYADAIGALESSSNTAVPEAISAHAATGVATLASLRDSFPAAARDALSASVAETAGNGPADRLGAFLRSQMNARSLGEQEGDSPDAILSRAEARLGEGDLAATLNELQGLPEQGRTAMSDWIDRAQTRAAAKSALSDLTAS